MFADAKSAHTNDDLPLLDSVKCHAFVRLVALNLPAHAALCRHQKLLEEAAVTAMIGEANSGSSSCDLLRHVREELWQRSGHSLPAPVLPSAWSAHRVLEDTVVDAICIGDGHGILKVLPPCADAMLPSIQRVPLLLFQINHSR
jgi:hypothetical protein